MFQCPTSGFSLFYGAKFKETLAKLACFNALLRAFLFSTVWSAGSSSNRVLFQCPTSGFSLFYNWRDFDSRCKEKSFQCPTSGFSLFYTEESKSELMTAVRFNALLRAFLFSTVKEEMEYLKLKCFNALLRAFLFSTLKKYMI